MWAEPGSPQRRGEPNQPKGDGMLVLTRKAGESIVIGNDVVVTINRTTKNTVSIGITAPDDVVVLRSELIPPNKGNVKNDDSRRT
jgi:carbon storage regulator